VSVSDRLNLPFKPEVARGEKIITEKVAALLEATRFSTTDGHR
jgi:hypothetical protein